MQLTALRWFQRSLLITGVVIAVPLMVEMAIATRAGDMSCEQLDRWADRFVTTSPHTREALLKVQPAQRRAALARFSPSRKAAIWQEQARDYLTARGKDLTEDQSRAVFEYLRAITPSIYETKADLAEFREMSRRVFALLPSNDVRFFIAISPLGTRDYETRSVPFFSILNLAKVFASSGVPCDCALGGPLDQCATGYSCEAPVCTTNQTCGPAGTDECNGRCIFIPQDR